MTVYVDDAEMPFRGMKMCHMVADTEEELHEMADEIGLKREWYQGHHYDVSLSKKREALENGAEEIDYLEYPKYSDLMLLRRRLKEGRA